MSLPLALLLLGSPLPDFCDASRGESCVVRYLDEHKVEVCRQDIRPVQCQRTIQNDQNYRDSDGNIHATEDSVRSSGPYTLNGRSFQYRKRSRITFYGGDLDAVSNKTRTCAQITARPGVWYCVRMLNAAPTSWSAVDGQTLRWNEVLPNADLFIRATRKGLRGRVQFDAATGWSYIDIEYVMPVAATVSADEGGASWTISGPVDQIRVGQGRVWDSSVGAVFAPETDATLIDSTTTLESNVAGATYRTLVFRVTPNASQVSSSLGAGRTVYVEVP